jgi:hypothetical protein
MYHQFNIQQLYVLPTQCIYVFCVDLRTNGDYFRIQCWFQNPHSEPWTFNIVRGLNDSCSLQTYAVATSRH